jgi:hypothetical protein
MKVLIVSKTHMYRHACIGGITEDNQSVRLLTNTGDNHPPDTELRVGQIWEMQLCPSDKIEPPHVEDTLIIGTPQFLGKHRTLAATIQRRVPHMIWRGTPHQLYKGMLQLPDSGSHNAYIAKSTGIPSQSTGFWIPVKPLKRFIEDRERVYYLYQQNNDATIKIPFVGFAECIEQIPAYTLMRMSLARWWHPDGMPEKRCYLQVSGWYFE